MNTKLYTYKDFRRDLYIFPQVRLPGKVLLEALNGDIVLVVSGDGANGDARRRAARAYYVGLAPLSRKLFLLELLPLPEVEAGQRHPPAQAYRQHVGVQRLRISSCFYFILQSFYLSLQFILPAKVVQGRQVFGRSRMGPNGLDPTVLVRATILSYYPNISIPSFLPLPFSFSKFWQCMKLTCQAPPGGPLPRTTCSMTL